MSSATDSVTPSEVADRSGGALKLKTDSPHLVNLGSDRLSTSVTLHPIPQGRVTLGCGPGVDIPVQGTGVLPFHCHIENSEGVVTIYPLSENLSLDGVKISRPTRLYQGVMLTIGRSNYMRFNHPAEAKIMKSVLPNPNPRISNVPITFESDTCFETKFNKKPPVVPKKQSPRESLCDSGAEESPSSIMTKVSKFEYLAQQNFKKSISPKVFTSNLVTVNTPAKDVLGKCPPNIQNFTKNLPQNVLNYSELNHNEKHQVKTPDRTIFGKKSPQYVNVALKETKNINNKVILFEKECISRNQNVNLDHNELNIKSPPNKNININKILAPSPNFNRNPGPCFRSFTPSPTSNSIKFEHQRSGSFGEIPRCAGSLENLEQRQNDAELKRTQAHQERIKEQEMEKVEKARLEEILNLCVEYEKQSQVEKSKSIPNRIKTNGSLPRDKRLAYGTPPSSPRDAEAFFHIENRHHSYENVNISLRPLPREQNNASYENVELKTMESNDNSCGQKSGSPYENVHFQQSSPILVPAHSPRTRIKTFILSPNKENTSLPTTPKETAEIIENKFAALEAELCKLQAANMPETANYISSSTPNRDSPSRFIFPLDETNLYIAEQEAANKSQNSFTLNNNSAGAQETVFKQSDGEENRTKIEKLRREKRNIMNIISSIKRQISEIDAQEEELKREIELEFALIVGEHKSKLLDLKRIESRKEKLVKYAQRIEENMHHHQVKQELDQKECKKKLESAQSNMNRLDEKLVNTPKSSTEYEQVFEEYLRAQEILDNERKTFEDLEFHHLEEEADWLASREEVQREIVELSKRIESVNVQIQDLEQQKYRTSSNTEFKIIKKRRSEYFSNLEKYNSILRGIEDELSTFCSQESDQEVSSDSDSDKSRDLGMRLAPHQVSDMSCSVIVSNSKTPIDHMSNMSQSFNEKLLQEKSILESGHKFPSQDDIDRICKVTSNAPIDIDEEQGSLGRKTIESLKDIQRKRHIHLHEQGSQVIEEERQRVLALKERVQNEVKSEWAQRRLDNDYPQYSDFTFENSAEISQSQIEKLPVSSPEKSDSTLFRFDGVDSPRPMSEISEMSVETGYTKKRLKPISDKQRPLTRYLPIRGSDLDLRQHIESAGHQVVLCPHVIINSSTCRGFLHKRGSKLNGWSKRWFVFDRNKHTFTYYNDKSEKRPRGGAYFQAIEEVYLDHLKSVKSPNPQLTFIVKTHERFYYLMAPSPEAMRIWVDVIFTGAEGYQEFEHGS